LTTLAGWLIEGSGNEDENTRWAVRWFGVVEKLSSSSGYELSPWVQTLKEQRNELTRQKLSPAEWEQAWSTGNDWSKEEAETNVEMLIEQL
jgi:hypothetical protein